MKLSISPRDELIRSVRRLKFQVGETAHDILFKKEATE